MILRTPVGTPGTDEPFPASLGALVQHLAPARSLGRQRFCSPVCRQAARRKPVTHRRSGRWAPIARDWARWQVSAYQCGECEQRYLGLQQRELLADDMWLDELIDALSRGGARLTGQSGFLPELVKAVLKTWNRVGPPYPASLHRRW